MMGSWHLYADLSLSRLHCIVFITQLKKETRMKKRELLENKVFQAANMEDEIVLEVSGEHKFRTVRIKKQEGNDNRVLVLSTRVK
jgi:hypothetical protein